MELKKNHKQNQKNEEEKKNSLSNIVATASNHSLDHFLHSEDNNDSPKLVIFFYSSSTHPDFPEKLSTKITQISKNAKKLDKKNNAENKKKFESEKIEKLTFAFLEMSKMKSKLKTRCGLDMTSNSLQSPPIMLVQSIHSFNTIDNPNYLFDFCEKKVLPNSEKTIEKNEKKDQKCEKKSEKSEQSFQLFTLNENDIMDANNANIGNNNNNSDNTVNNTHIEDSFIKSIPKWLDQITAG